MIARCHDPSFSTFEDYGLAGIKVCGRWKGTDGFKNFIKDMGKRPPGKPYEIHLDRIDSDYGYTPWNCRWVTNRENQLNRHTTRWITFKGKTMCLFDWSNLLGINQSTLSIRLNYYKLPIEIALTKPVHGRQLNAI